MLKKDELIDKLKKSSFDVYEIVIMPDETIAIQLLDLEDLIRFAQKHKIDTMFYYFNFIECEDLMINDRLIHEMHIDDDMLSVLDEKFDKYNSTICGLDFSRPIALNVYCAYQGIIYFIQESYEWFIKEGFNYPEIIVKQLAEDCKDKIESRKKVTEEKILLDEQFHQCTNERLRKIYTDKLFKNNSELQRLFYSERCGIYDIDIRSFVEKIWKEYKKSLKQ